MTASPGRRTLVAGDRAVLLELPDLEAASGIDLGAGTQAEVDAQADAVETYLLAHFTPSSGDGAWSVSEGDLVVSNAGNASTTGIYEQVETTFTLTPVPASTLPNACVS